MKRKEIELFSLSFLDLLFGALGSIIFMFIIVPKGGAPPNPNKAIPVALDMVSGKLFGDFSKISENAKVGDTLLVLATGLGTFPISKNCPPQIICPPCPPQKPCPEIDKPLASTFKDPPKASGLEFRPSLACKFSIEIHWNNEQNNVDLYVCKSGVCVSGQSSKRTNNQIGSWDSGKSLNNWKELLKKKDYRNKFEAVRQISQLIPGTFEIYAVFKESSLGDSNVEIKGMIYSELDGGRPQVQMLNNVLSLNPNTKVLLGTCVLASDGTFTFR